MGCCLSRTKQLDNPDGTKQSPRRKISDLYYDDKMKSLLTQPEINNLNASYEEGLEGGNNANNKPEFSLKLNSDVTQNSGAELNNNKDYNKPMQNSSKPTRKRKNIENLKPLSTEYPNLYNLPNTMTFIKIENLSCKYEDNLGTQISSEKMDENSVVAAIAHEHGKIQWHLDILSSNSLVFNEISNKLISIDMINVFKHESIFITSELHKRKVVDILHKLKIDYELNEQLTKITIIGSKIRGIPGIMSKVVTSLQGKIDILQTSDSHTTISILVPTVCANEAVNLLHQEFQLAQ